jgi:branched-chain amino acid transport system permease protein
MGYIQAIIILGGVSVIAGLGVAILTGYTGLFSMGHAGFMALGGYLATVLVKEYHFPLLVGLLLGGLFAGACSFIIGIPAFRSKLRGDYFAIATLGFAEAVRLILNNVKQVGNVALGGAYGYMEIPLLDDLTRPIPGYIYVLVLALACLYLAQMFVNSQRGKNCIAVGQDEVAAQMMGVDLLRTKLTALFISAFFCGVAGGILGFFMGYLTPSFFGIARSSDLLAAVVFGGIQSLVGPVITSLILVAVPQMLLQFAEYRLIIYGLLFVVVMVFRPQGLLGYYNLRFSFRGRTRPSMAKGK